MRTRPNFLDRVRWAIAGWLVELGRFVAPAEHIATLLAGREPNSNEGKET